VKASKQTEKVQEVNAIEEEFRLDPSIGENFKKAIEKAIQIAVDKNLDSIRGVTYVFCDVSGSMGAQISGGKKYGSIRTCMDCGFILGLMIKSKC
jgi:telomerase protein component 1